MASDDNKQIPIACLAPNYVRLGKKKRNKLEIPFHNLYIVVVVVVHVAVASVEGASTSAACPSVPPSVCPSCPVCLPRPAPRRLVEMSAQFFQLHIALGAAHNVACRSGMKVKSNGSRVCLTL